MIAQYEQLEKQLSSQKVKGDCWVIEEEVYVDFNGQYSDCYIVEPPELELLGPWGGTYMIPLINEALNGTYKDENGKQTPYGVKYDLW